MSTGARSAGYYVLALLLFGAAIYAVVAKGDTLRPDLVLDPASIGEGPSPIAHFLQAMGEQIYHPMAVLLMQILAIIAVARLFAFLFNKIGQPAVIGEIVAGIVLGPSIVGYWFPGVFAFLFPQGSLVNLHFMSQIGLVLFMFVIGMELDLKLLAGRARNALLISHTGIIIMYALGVGLAYRIYLEFAPPTVPFLSFALFMGIAMSITAFPVLARIIQERGLTRTPLGTMALATAASDDVTAWCLLAAVIAIVKAGTMLSALYTMAAAGLYVAFMLLLLRPFLQRLGDIHATRGVIHKPIMALVFLVLLLSAWTTEVIGIHPLFGAFLAGVVMPANLNFRKLLVNKLEDVSVVLLLPLFFVYTGLRTRIGLLNDEHLWWTCGMVIAVAVIGKAGAVAMAARVTGHSWKESFTLGALMNTRGLMELVVLNIGYDLGVINAELFAILVLMALVSTFMTGPALDLIERLFRSEVKPAATTAQGPAWRVLLSFGQPESGRRSLKLAYLLAGGEPERASVTALHVSHSQDLNPLYSGEFERDGFKPIQQEAERNGMLVQPVHRVSNDVSREIVHMANDGRFDLLLIGAGKPLFQGTFLGDLLGFTGRVMDPSKLIGSITGRDTLLPADDQLDPRARQMIEEVQCSVGVLLDKGFDTAKNVLLPITTPGDHFMLHYAERLLNDPASRLTVLDVNGLADREPSFRAGLQHLANSAPDRIDIVPPRYMNKEFLEGFDLMLTSYTGWVKAAEERVAWQADVPSTLIMKA